MKAAPLLLLTTLLLVPPVSPYSISKEEVIARSRRCTLINRNLPGATTATLEDVPSFGECVLQCQDLGTCHAVVYNPRSQRCLAKEQGYRPPTNPDRPGRYLLALEMCCLDSSC